MQEKEIPIIKDGYYMKMVLLPDGTYSEPVHLDSWHYELLSEEKLLGDGKHG